MPIIWRYTNKNDKYAQCYRLQELLRLEFNKGNLTSEEHYKLEREVLIELLKLRDQIKKDTSNITTLADIYGV